MKIIFAGTPANAARTLQQLVVAGYDVVGVLTREDAPVGRKRTITPSAVASLANDLELPLIKSNKMSHEVISKLTEFNADLGVVVAFGTIFSEAMLRVPKKGWINLHYSVLPRWRGAAPVQHSILSGDTETGVTVFQLDSGMDSGPIWAVARTTIEAHETAGDLLSRLTDLGVSTLLEAIPKAIFAIESPVIQASGHFDIATKPDRKLARLDFSRTAIELERQVRAMNPEPMAWCTWRDEVLQVLSAAALGKTDWVGLGESAEGYQPGTIREFGDRVLVACGSGSLLELKSVKPAGKSGMDSSAWRRGFSKESDWVLK